jgi:hypothetical protein
MPLYLKDKLVSGTGASGKSAYQTAVDAGYTGTETAFNEALSDVPGHINNTENPHRVTAAQAGAVASTEKGAASGVATLGADSLLAASQRPKAGGLYRDDGTTTLEKSLIDLNSVLSSKVNRAGDTMTNDLLINKNGYTMTFAHNQVANKNNLSSNYVSLEFTDPVTNTNENLLQVRKFNGSSGSLFNIHHTGNKPSGSYTGNGSATKRTIDTGGTGDICLVWGYTYASIVTPYGTLSRYYNDETPVNLKMSQISFEKGVLTIETDNPVCNYNTATYYYQVL